MKVLNIGPCVVKDCINGVNDVEAAGEVKILAVDYIMVSPNFVHPDQSYLLALVLYRKRYFGYF